MILAVVFVGIAGAEIQLGPAVGAVEQAGEHAGSSCFGRPAFVLPQFLHPFPLALLNDGGLGILKNALVLNRVFHPLFEFQGLGIGLAVHGTAPVSYTHLRRPSHALQGAVLCCGNLPYLAHL